MPIFICSIIPQDFINEFNVSQASNSFCMRIINTGHFDSVISLLPVTVNRTLPGFDAGNIHLVQYRSVPKFIPCHRYFNALVETIRAFKLCRKTNHIWFYNINNQNVFLYVLLRYILKARCFVLLADFTPPLKKYSLSSCIAYILAKSHGLILLSSRATILNSNSCCLPGIIESFHSSNHMTRSINRRDFLFSGFLGDVTGIDFALEFFATHPNYHLYITGRGDSVELVQQYDSRYENITYLGFLDYNEYLYYLDKVDFCLNFRNPHLQENLNNFPSKFLEYLSYGKIVISTISYPELAGICYFSSDFDMQQVEALFSSIVRMTDAQLMAYKNNFDKLQSLCSVKAWENAFSLIESKYDSVR